MTPTPCHRGIDTERSDERCEHLGWREKPGMFEGFKALMKFLGLLFGSAAVVALVVGGIVLAVGSLVS